jgi:hypothetical protein
MAGGEQHEIGETCTETRAIRMTRHGRFGHPWAAEGCNRARESLATTIGKIVVSVKENYQGVAAHVGGTEKGSPSEESIRRGRFAETPQTPTLSPSRLLGSFTSSLQIAVGSFGDGGCGNRVRFVAALVGFV